LENKDLLCAILLYHAPAFLNTFDQSMVKYMREFALDLEGKYQCNVSVVCNSHGLPNKFFKEQCKHLEGEFFELDYASFSKPEPLHAKFCIECKKTIPRGSLQHHRKKYPDHNLDDASKLLHEKSEMSEASWSSKKSTYQCTLCKKEGQRKQFVI
jgi:hypothetical protein